MNALSALFVDLYELTMSQVYYERDMTGEAVFELTIRSMPEGWEYLIAAGLERALQHLETMRFHEADLEFVASLPQFDAEFIARLREFRFTGDVWAPFEGTAVYPHEPLIQIVAPLPEAQIMETALLNQMSFPTLVASKAARVVDAAAGRPVIEFGGRRAYGSEAAIEAARATYIAGFEATSSVEAGRQYGIPTTGTMAHSFVLANGDERRAFDAYASRYPGTTLLVDTFDTATGVDHAIEVARRHGAESVGAIRIDSGDLLQESRQAADRLSEAGLTGVRIVASGGLDEHKISSLFEAGAPIDVYACGTNVVTPPDASALDSAYKLVQYDGRSVARRSTGKPYLGQRKQVWRSTDCDLIAPHDVPAPTGAEPLLRLVMSGGRRTPVGSESLARIRERAMSSRGPRHVTVHSALLD